MHPESYWGLASGVACFVIPVAISRLAYHYYTSVARQLFRWSFERHLKRIRATNELHNDQPSPEYRAFCATMESLRRKFATKPPTLQQLRQLMTGQYVLISESQYTSKYVAISVRTQDAVRDEIPAYWVVPFGQETSNRVILYLHGGAFVAGSARDYFPFAARIGRLLKARVFVVDYCLAPEYRLPVESGQFAPVVETIHAYSYLLQTGASAENIVMMGDSGTTRP